MKYPINAVSNAGIISGTNSIEIVSGSSGFETYIYNITTEMELPSELGFLYCGGSIIYSSGEDYSQGVDFMYHCPASDVTVFHIGDGDFYYSITYSTTSPAVQNSLNGFTYGDIVISTILFFMFTLMFFGGLYNKVIGMKKKDRAGNEYLFNSPEGKGKYID